VLEPAEVLQGAGVEGEAPERSLWYVGRLGPGEDALRLGDQLVGGDLDKLDLSDGHGHGAGVDSHGGEATEAGGEVCGPPAAEGVEDPLARPSVGQMPRGKVEGEHGEVGAQGVEAELYGGDHCLSSCCGTVWLSEQASPDASL